MKQTLSAFHSVCVWRWYLLGSGMSCPIITFICQRLRYFSFNGLFFLSVRLKENLMCMEESDPFDFEKDPDVLMISKTVWRISMKLDPSTGL